MTDVFGVGRDIPENYVARPNVDDEFVESLGRDRHIVVYGSSKQGKTCLRKRNLNDSDYISVHCANRWTLRDLHANVLKRAGFEITESTVEVVGGGKKINVSVSTGLDGLGKVGFGGGKEVSKSTQSTKTPMQIDANDVNDVIGALTSISFSKFIVLEDFHYLPVESQKDFSVALKAFHENSKYCFIIVGVWLDESRLTVYNGDLTGRITPINADAWSEAELREVVDVGEALLNVSFPEPLKTELIQAAQGSVAIVQESCFELCNRGGVYKTVEVLRILGEGTSAAALVKEVVDKQRGRYKSFLTQFANGFQSTALDLYRWLLLPVVAASAKRLEAGLKLNQIYKCLMANHPKGAELNPGSVTQALQYSASLQSQKDIKPIVLDYDVTNTELNLVDRGFLIWLSHQDRSEILDSLGLPIDPKLVPS